ncbi:heavy-metal-associated domain-containing protein [Puerhibacterium sp. TATVAM-FAB25]|uniref:heavy-metal-associated domain-containing protein n=1 Tax=Puerhibacterium sp. TATVAM-FAB25 TaxID=3093699 RepID=UPI00397B6895
MTCGHCVGAVTGELSRLEGVRAVDVALVAGGVSTVTLTSRGPLSAGDLAGAVANAGYELTDLAG